MKNEKINNEIEVSWIQTYMGGEFLLSWGIGGRGSRYAMESLRNPMVHLGAQVGSGPTWSQASLQYASNRAKMH